MFMYFLLFCFSHILSYPNVHVSNSDDNCVKKNIIILDYQVLVEVIRIWGEQTFEYNFYLNTL